MFVKETPNLRKMLQLCTRTLIHWVNNLFNCDKSILNIILSTDNWWISQQTVVFNILILIQSRWHTGEICSCKLSRNLFMQLVSQHWSQTMFNIPKSHIKDVALHCVLNIAWDDCCGIMLKRDGYRMATQWGYSVDICWTVSKLSPTFQLISYTNGRTFGTIWIKGVWCIAQNVIQGKSLY